MVKPSSWGLPGMELVVLAGDGLWTFRNRPLLWEAAELLTQLLGVYKLSSAPRSFLTLFWTGPWNIT